MSRRFFSPFIGVALIAVLIVGAQTLLTVSQWEQAIIIQLGQFKRTIQEPGLHWKIPFVQQIHKIERRILSNDSELGISDPGPKTSPG